MQPTPGFAQGWESGDKAENLQGMLQGRAFAEGSQQAATAALERQRNYTTLTPQQLGNLHPNASQMLSGMGQQNPDGSMTFHNNIIPEIPKITQYQVEREAKSDNANRMKKGIEDMYRDPTTGVPNIPPEVKLGYDQLGPNADPKLMEQLQNHLFIRAMQRGTGPQTAPPLPGMKPSITQEINAQGLPVNKTSWSYPSRGELDDAIVRVTKGAKQYVGQASPTELQMAHEYLDDHKLRMQRAGATQITLGKMEGAAEGPLAPKDLMNWADPKTGELAVSNPLVYGGKNAKDLQRMGLIQLSGEGGGKEVGSAIVKARVANGHLDLIDKAIDDPRFADLFPPASAGITQARLSEVWRRLASVQDWRIAYLQQLGGQAGNYLPAVSSQGMRMGMQYLKFVEQGLPTNPAAPWSREGAHAALQALRDGIGASLGGKIPQGMSPSVGARSQAPAAGTRAGDQSVSGAKPKSGMAAWLESQKGIK